MLIEKQKKYINIIFPILLLSMIIMSMFSYAMPLLLLLFIVIFFIYGVVIEAKESKINDNNNDKLKIRITNVFNNSKWLLISLSVYILSDIITYFYSVNLESAFRKVDLSLQIIVLFLFATYYIVNELKLKLFFLLVCVASTFVSIWAYFSYFLKEKPVYFYRLSSRSDYNYFSTIIVVGLIFGLVYFMNYSKLSYIKRLLITAILSIINIPAIYLSGSRRMIIMLPIFFAFAVLYDVIRLLIKKDKKHLLQNAGILVVVCAVYLCSVAISGPFTKYAEIREKKYQEKYSQTGSDEEVDSIINESSIKDIIGSISDGSMTNRREIIYTEAFNNIKNFSITEMIFGKGAAYDLYMFDNTTNEKLLSEYNYNLTDKRPPKNWMSTHNFLISDMLNGGLIKVAAALWFVVSLIIYLIKAIIRKKRVGVILTLGISLILVNNSISGEFGFMNDGFFAIIMSVLVAVLTLYGNKTKSIDLLEQN